MAVTEQQRREVREADCAEHGHLLSFDHAVQLGGKADAVAGPDGLQPHILCRRCRKVWLIIEQPEPNYETATVALDARMLPEHRRPRPVRGGTPATPTLS